MSLVAGGVLAVQCCVPRPPKGHPRDAEPVWVSLGIALVAIVVLSSAVTAGIGGIGWVLSPKRPKG